MEKDYTLNFLDVSHVTINRKNNSFCTSVHHKPTFTGLGLRFDSFAPKSYLNII